MRHTLTLFTATAGLMSACAISQPPPTLQPSSPRWAETMAEFASEDATLETGAGQVLFLGSSSIRGWDLEEHFPDLPALNRGFGGSAIRDSVHHFESLVPPHSPEVIVFYAGDNDIAGGLDAPTTLEHYQIFTGLVHDALPETTVIFVAIKPSTLRWDFWPTMREANALIEEYSATDDRLVYVDIATPGLDPETGEPRTELLRDDGLHLTREGYELWTSLVRPEIDAALADD